jgi:flagellar biosynthesis protein FliQ
MESGVIIDLVYQALRMAAVLAGPILMALLVVGLIIGILQAATSVNESTVAFVPKLLVFGIVILFKELFARIPGLVN